MFVIDLRSPDPIFMQIVDQTKRAISKGYLVEGDRMPSIRQMAKDLAVNQSTITRAYRELENEGIITTVAGRGTFISLDQEKINIKKEDMKERLKAILQEAIFYKLTKEEIIKMYEELEGKNETKSQ